MAYTNMYPGIENSPETQVVGGVQIADTSITVLNAAVLPAAPNYLVLGHANAEIVYYPTAAVNGVFSNVTRGVNGTTIRYWPDATPVARRFCAVDLTTLQANILDLETRVIEAATLALHEVRIAMPTLGAYIEGLEANTNTVNVACITGITAGDPDFQLAADPGRWFLSTDQRTRIRQDCDITDIQFYVGPSNTPTEFWFMVWRDDPIEGWVLVGEENVRDRMVAGQINWITLTTPIAVKTGDYIGYGGIGTGMFLTPIEGATISTYYKNMAHPVSGFVWSTGSTINTYVPLRAFGRAPVIVCIGDSITAGHPGNYSFIEATQTTDPASEYPHHLAVRTGKTVQNMGIGGETSADVLARFETDCVYLHPKVAIITVGLNDIQQSVTTADFLAYMFSILDACVAGGIVPVIVGLPWTAATDAQSILLRSWFDLVIDILEGYDDATFVYAWTLLGSGTNQWDIKAKYDSGDGLHYNEDGYRALTTAILSAKVGSP